MDWILLIVLLVTAYALVAYYIYTKKLWQDRITFYGPLMAIKTERVGFFDRFLPFGTFLRLYGTLGVLMVIVVSVLMTVLLIISVQHIVVQRPALTMANDPKNVLAIPGVNDFIPFTFAVWFGLIVTMIVHEFGHAVLCRVEGIRVKTMGVLLAVIPIGAFVEPDEEDQEKTRGLAKIRMFGAGITNNILMGVICFVAIALLLGMVVPLNAPLVHGVYVDSPAYHAGVPPNSVIREVNGISVGTRDDVASILNSTKPGDTVTLLIDNKGKTESHSLTLTSWPQELSPRTSGFMGVTYYDATAVKEQFGLLHEPIGIIILLAVPLYTIMDPATWGQFSILTVDTVDALMWQVPFPHFWFVIQLLFWCGWFNLVVGTFNALPLLPLDGGLILKESVDRLLDRRGLMKYSGYVVGAISYGMLAVLLSVMILPYMLNL
ncbi:site-2 protease family protein [uncultured Methanoregula sp.]|uniref:site-2 protease family protein n=1 Tax=uncultured Methanoregula sp. TaxID=1005933 RepID=UPI002AAB2F04|nr:site-2 protease family protein [uncultured Methanoregula sp.]